MTNKIYTPDIDNLTLAAQLIEKGEVISIPTETVYGVACDAANDIAVDKLFEAKQRDYSKPLQVLLPSVEAALQIGEFDARAEKIGRKFWPGGLTLIIKIKHGVKLAEMVSGNGTIGIRIPDHPLALAIIKKFGRPVAASSANISGEPPALTAMQAYEALGGKVTMVIDGGKVKTGVPSTVVDATGRELKIIRPGSITEKMLLE